MITLEHALLLLASGLGLVTLGAFLLLISLVVMARIKSNVADSEDAQFDAYMDGYHCGADGTSIVNPFPSGSVLHTEWNRGFGEGVLEREDRR